jgi:hypothetical protein
MQWVGGTRELFRVGGDSFTILKWKSHTTLFFVILFRANV